jgi:hypothetical protein
MWEVALDPQRAGPNRMARREQLGDRSAHERAPALRALRRVERELVALVEVDGVGLDPAAGARLGRHRDAAVDRERQGEPPL